MRRADRLFHLVTLLRGARVAVTAGSLATRLEVSERTVYRDIKDLQGNGVPIDGEAGVGYRLRREFDLPPMMFDTEEVQALLFGARLVGRFGDRALSKAAERALEKIEASVPRKVRDQLAHSPIFVMSFRGDNDAKERAGTFRRAIDERRKIDVDYNDREGVATTRVICPIALWFWGAVWTLGAWCELRNDYRAFRIDRFERLDVTTTTFPDEAPYTLDALTEALGSIR